MASALCALAPGSFTVNPAEAKPVALDIPAGDLSQALIALSRQSGLSIGIAGELPAHRTPKVRGSIEPTEALARMLRGSGLQAVTSANGLLRLVPTPRRLTPKASDGARTAIADIVVTGRKRDERLNDVPISISVIRPDGDGTPAASRGVHDVLSSIEGAFATNLGPGRDRIFLRGVADSAFNGPTQATVSLFLDEARVSYATPDPDLRLVDIARVELLRGPQGTLYGSGALGGIVRIVPNKPDLASWSGTGAIEGSAIGGGGYGGAAEVVLNAPIMRDRLGIRSAFYADRTGGWIDDPTRAARNVNRVTRYGARLSGRWAFAEDWTADISLSAQWIDARDSQYATRGLTKNTAIAEPHDNDFLAATLSIHGRIGDLDLISASAFVTHEVTSLFDAGAVAGLRALPVPLGYQDVRELTLATQEWRISDPAAVRPWLAGISLLSAENSYRGTFLPDGAPSMALLALHDDALEAAAFGELTQPITDRLGVTAGTRVFFAKIDNEQAGQTRRRARKSGLTPSATLSWRVGDGSLLWLRYASAIRPGGINPDGDPSARAFRADDLKSIELGWRLRGWRDRLHINGAIFGLRWKNVQSDIAGTDGLIRTINAGRARNIGMELRSTLNLAPFSLDGNITVQHGRLYRPSTAANAVGDDNRLPVLPDYAGRLKLSLDLPLGALDASWFVAARYIGSARLSFDPDLARSMGDYWLADGGLSLTAGPWRSIFSITNLTDRRGDSFSFGNPFSLRLADQRTPAQPRSLNIRIERKF